MGLRVVHPALQLMPIVECSKKLTFAAAAAAILCYIVTKRSFSKRRCISRKAKSSEKPPRSRSRGFTLPKDCPSQEPVPRRRESEPTDIFQFLDESVHLLDESIRGLPTVSSWCSFTLSVRPVTEDLIYDGVNQHPRSLTSPVGRKEPKENSSSFGFQEVKPSLRRKKTEDQSSCTVIVTRADTPVEFERMSDDGAF